MGRVNLCLIAVLILQGAASIAYAGTACARTPAEAVQMYGAEPSPFVAGGKGYRVTSAHWDSVLQQGWARIARCDHPGWPEFSLRIDEVRSTPSRSVVAARQEVFPTAPLVRAGDIVRLWRQEDLLRIEVTGVAEESGGLGKTIRVRLLRRNTDDQSREEQFTGVVRGPGDVEMQP